MWQKLLKTAACLLLIFITFAYNPIVKTEAAQSAVINTDLLNVRGGPGQTYEVIAQVKKNETYPIVERKNDWVKLQLNSTKSGWVASWLIKENKTVVSKVASLRVRTGPGTNYPAIGYLNKGQEVNYVGETKDWTKIKYKNSDAWVSSEYITLSGSFTGSTSQSTSQPDQPKLKTAVVTASSLNVRDSGSLSGKVIASLKKGALVTVENEVNNWSNISLSNGKKGWVSSAYLSVTNAAQPIMYLKGKTIVIDAGHGGYDQGSAGVKGTLEKNLTLRTALLVSDKLKKAGANVVLTRKSDYYIGLQDRVNVAQYYNADVFVSIHYDSSSENNAHGITSYYYKDADSTLASTLQQELIKAAKLTDRRQRFGNYHVLRENKKPAVLLELGYLSNSSEEQIINTNIYQENVSNAICNGLVQYFNK